MILGLRIVFVFYEVMYVQKTFSLLTFFTLILRSFEYHSDYQIKSGNFMKKSSSQKQQHTLQIFTRSYSWTSVQPKPLFWFRSNTETETQIGRYFRPIL